MLKLESAPPASVEEKNIVWQVSDKAFGTDGRREILGISGFLSLKDKFS